MKEAMENLELIKYLKNFYGDAFEQFWLAGAEPKAIRVNTLKGSRARMEEKLRNWQVDFRPLSFNKDGLTLNNDHLPLSHTLEFFTGAFQYQGMSSQIPPLVLQPKPGERVLDMAAAPGSKSTQLAALMNNEGMLVVNDAVRSRLQSLNANLQKAGALNHIITYLPAERFGNLFPNYFDKILLDAPCTALGTLCNSKEVASWWSLEKLKKLSLVQNALMIAAYKALKPGGELVYSTCSIAPEENEMIVQNALDKYNLEILPIKNISGIDFLAGLSSYHRQIFHPHMPQTLRVAPHIHQMEGFYIARLRKTAAHKVKEYQRRPTFRPTLDAHAPDLRVKLTELSEYWGIDQNIWQNYRFMLTKNRIWMTKRFIDNVMQDGFTSVGLLLAEKKSRVWKLFNQSVQLLADQIRHRRIRLDREQLQILFKRGTIENGAQLRGYYILDWQDMPIASLYADEASIRIRLPHSFRLVL